MGISVSPPTPSHADVSIVVSAAEDCVWYLENLPAVINMSSATKYKGDPLTVRATISPAIGFSGDPEAPGYTAACSFYNSSFTTKKMQVAIDSSQFVATYGGTTDESLTFGLDQRPLSVQVSNVEQSCQSVTGMPLTVPANFGWGRNKSAASTALDVVAYTDVPDYGVKNFFPSGNSAKCSPELEFEVEISSSQSGPPAGAGQTYVFNGPSITFSMGDSVATYDSVEVQAQNAFRDLAPNPIATYRFDTYSTSKQFFFSTGRTSHIYAGSMNGRPADFRVVAKNAHWRFLLEGGSTKFRNNTFTTNMWYTRNNKSLRAWVVVDYQIDYRFPGDDWVIDAASDSRVSNTLIMRVN